MDDSNLLSPTLASEGFQADECGLFHAFTSPGTNSSPRLPEVSDERHMGSGARFEFRDGAVARKVPLFPVVPVIGAGKLRATVVLDGETPSIW
ncbi:hypothetical protein [Haladaptatus sp. DYF46]|uniref:hypothetical protein n=1 Tax=Haladaptatus sp. DYF46 TaxID=2886041 RepID=UPI001E535198|nr:hypothetical protein [Haladaptatus sp. DYF46]